jgi:hypothetical protein
MMYAAILSSLDEPAKRNENGLLSRLRNLAMPRFYGRAALGFSL